MTDPVTRGFVRLGALHWCYNATGHEVVLRHFEALRFAARLAPWSWVERPWRQA